VKREAGFTLIELLVAMQGLIASGRSGERLALLLRERTVQRRTLALCALSWRLLRAGARARLALRPATWRGAPRWCT
jgi:phosphopantothenate synthetase